MWLLVWNEVLAVFDDFTKAHNYLVKYAEEEGYISVVREEKESTANFITYYVRHQTGYNTCVILERIDFNPKI